MSLKSKQITAGRTQFYKTNEKRSNPNFSEQPAKILIDIKG